MATIDPMASDGGDKSMASPAKKLHGRAFYESIGKPKFVVAPMVDQSEFAWRLLTRSFMTSESSKQLLAYSPMMHSRMFHETPKYRNCNFEPLKQTLPEPEEAPHPPSNVYMDGNPDLDRPLFVQFCSNSPNDLYQAARYVAPFCDAVDLNLGCPQGIAKRGKYGAFLQEDWKLIYDLINRLHNDLDVPVTAKIRILDTKERTLEYAKMVLEAGASIITVHGRQREQKGHNTGLADWTVLRYLRDNLPKDTVIFANGNILQYEDVDECLNATGADAVMSAEGNLYDPSIFAQPPPVGQEGREYWRGRDGKGGYRMDAALRRYMDILYKYVLQTDPPARKPLFITSDPVDTATTNGVHNRHADIEMPTAPVAAPVPSKKRKRVEMKQQNNGKNNKEVGMSINLKVVQAHLFHMLRPLVAKHTHVRDALARSRAGDIAAFENVLQLTEQLIKQGLLDYENGVDDGMPVEKPKKEAVNGTPTNDGLSEEATNGASADINTSEQTVAPDTAQTDGEKKLAQAEADFTLSSEAAVIRCRRPWWIMQPYVRPLPEEALKNGALTLSRKERARLEQEEQDTKKVGLVPEGRIETQKLGSGDVVDGVAQPKSGTEKVEIARDGMVSG